MAQNPYPIATFHFRVEWGGTRIGFTEVTGLALETQVVEYREGASPEFHTRKMPGMQKFGNLTMKRGMVQKDQEFFNWWNTVSLNTIERRNITIQLLDENHDPVVTWRIKNAFPVKVDGPNLNATANEAAIESIEVAHEGITIEFV